MYWISVMVPTLKVTCYFHPGQLKDEYSIFVRVQNSSLGMHVMADPEKCFFAHVSSLCAIKYEHGITI